VGKQFLAESEGIGQLCGGDAMGQARKTFVIEVPAARVAAALSLLEIGNIARHNFATSEEESEALHEIAQQMRMQLLHQGARPEGSAPVSASA